MFIPHEVQWDVLAQLRLYVVAIKCAPMRCDDFSEAIQEGERHCVEVIVHEPLPLQMGHEVEARQVQLSAHGLVEQHVEACDQHEIERPVGVRPIET